MLMCRAVADTNAVVMWVKSDGERCHYHFELVLSTFCNMIIRMLKSVWGRGWIAANANFGGAIISLVLVVLRVEGNDLLIEQVP